MDPTLHAYASKAPGFMPDDEGLALHDAALAAAGNGPLVEIGSYLGRSTLYLAAAARARGGTVVTVDHHRGSEEHQPGWEYHDPELLDADGRLDTLPGFRRTVAAAGVEDVVVAVVGRAETVAGWWGQPAALVFLDGSHTDESAQRDYTCWAPHVAPGGTLAIHDVFADPADGGQAPYRIYRRALDSGDFEELPGHGSLRLLRRVR
ncbi:MAG: 1-O-methyltransferase [Actinoplanes sp.]|jgi:predicted O-methyltransferase YrrM|nr:1-O-methyltransferase [Actinoplanes sp.]